MSTLLHVILDRAPALATLAQECKGCHGTLCKGCHGTEHEGGCPYAGWGGRMRPPLTWASPATTFSCGCSSSGTRAVLARSGRRGLPHRLSSLVELLLPRLGMCSL